MTGSWHTTDRDSGNEYTVTEEIDTDTMTTNQLIRQLRTAAHASQQDVANRLGMARSTYATLEDGREPRLSELQGLARLYNLTLDELAAGLSAPSDVEPVVLAKQGTDRPREVNPRLNPEKLREVLLYVTNKIGAKANVGETVLYKLLYFIDFDFYEKHGTSITGLTYVKLPHGPVPQQRSFASVVSSMEARHELELVRTTYFSLEQKKYLPLKPLRDGPLDHLSARELEHINWEIERLSDKTAAQLSELSHYDMPWLVAQAGKPIDYQFVFYRTGITAVTEPADDL